MTTRNTFCLAAIFTLLFVPALAQKELLVGRWIYAAEIYNEYLVKALGPIGSIDHPDSIATEIMKEKLTSAGSYDMVFSKNDQCESQGVKFNYSFDGKILTLNREKYRVTHLDDKQFVMCENGGTCTMFFKDAYFKKLSTEQLREALQLNRYDSLLIRYVSDKNALAKRRYLFKISALPRYSPGMEAVDAALRKRLGERYAGINQDSSESSFTANLTFVIEPDGSASAVGLDAMETQVYEAFVEVFDDLNAKWVTIKKDGKPVACKVEIPIRYNQ